MPKKLLTQDTSPRPYQLIEHGVLERIIQGIRVLMGGDRFANLYKSIEKTIKDLPLGNKDISMLDYGCGVMSIPIKLKEQGVINSFIGMDIYEPPESRDALDGQKWASYVRINSSEQKALIRSFDVAMLVDVLHHVENENEIISILQYLSSQSKYLLIKDHIEYGLISRQILRLADWFGNYAYGVKVPGKYFSIDEWNIILKKAGLVEFARKGSVKVHGGIFGVILPSKCHYISVLIKES